MKLFLLTDPQFPKEQWGYNLTDSIEAMVIAAKNEETARAIAANFDRGSMKECSWSPVINCEKIGLALNPNFEGVICFSYSSTG